MRFMPSKHTLRAFFSNCAFSQSQKATIFSGVLLAAAAQSGTRAIDGAPPAAADSGMRVVLWPSGGFQVTDKDMQGIFSSAAMDKTLTLEKAEQLPGMMLARQ